MNDVVNNRSISKAVDVNGTTMLVINGTLPNGTTAAGSPDSAAAGLRMGWMEVGGWRVVVAIGFARGGYCSAG